MNKIIIFLKKIDDYYWSGEGAWMDSWMRMLGWAFKWTCLLWISYSVFMFVMVEFVVVQLPKLCTGEHLDDLLEMRTLYGDKFHDWFK